MSNKSISILVLIASALPFWSTATAAPLWIERQFIPASELIDPAFEEHDPASTQEPDHTALGNLLRTHLKESPDGINRFDYGAVSADERDALGAYIGRLSAMDVTTLNRDTQLAFWINLYNAVTLALIVDNYPTDSIRDIDNPWNKKRVTVNAIPLTLNDIESRVIRPVFNDPRIHYAVNCASIGCPNLATTPYTAQTLETMLDAAAREFVNHPRGVRIEPDGDIVVSKIYGWYKEDFGKNSREVLDHIRQYASPDLLKRLEGARKINKHEYDWAINDTNSK